jgi:hypothetical protein
LLQAQNCDGSWSDGSVISVVAGGTIPESPGEMPPLLFLTAFAIAAMRARANADQQKWELVEEKGMDFLERANPGTNWTAIINEFVTKYF